jgi:hypothetical protein
LNKIGEKGKSGSAWTRGGGGEREGIGAQGGEIAQTMYAHMNKWINEKKILIKKEERKKKTKRKAPEKEKHTLSALRFHQGSTTLPFVFSSTNFWWTPLTPPKNCQKQCANTENHYWHKIQVQPCIC